jgi:hypothetical protein
VRCKITNRFRAEGDAEKTTEITMTMKKHALLIALASALALGAVTTSFAQEAVQSGSNGGRYQFGNGSSQYAPAYDNGSGYAGPSAE